MPREHRVRYPESTPSIAASTHPDFECEKFAHSTARHCSMVEQLTASEIPRQFPARLAGGCKPPDAASNRPAGALNRRGRYRL